MPHTHILHCAVDQFDLCRQYFHSHAASENLEHFCLLCISISYLHIYPSRNVYIYLYLAQLHCGLKLLQLPTVTILIFSFTPRNRYKKHLLASCSNNIKKFVFVPIPSPYFVAQMYLKVNIFSFNPSRLAFLCFSILCVCAFCV